MEFNGLYKATKMGGPTLWGFKPIPLTLIKHSHGSM